MIRTLLASLAAVAALTLSSTAAPVEAHPSQDLAKQLIADILDINPSTIRIASIVEGSKRCKDGFERRWCSRVTAVLPVIDNGRAVRRVRSYDLMWSEQYGWFHQETIDGRGGEEVWIWSEKSGEITIR